MHPSEGTLNIEGGTATIKGTMTICYNGSALGGTVNITDGGVLTAKQVSQAGGSTNGGKLTLDGGTLRAYADNASFLNAHNDLHLYVGANGGTFDSAGYAITIAEDIEDVSGSAGKATFAGGGTITFTGSPLHTGGTTLEGGTILSLSSTVRAALFVGGFTVAIPEGGVADGAVALVASDDVAFTQSELESITLSGNDNGRYSLILANDNKAVAIADTLAGEYVWNGGASGASWKTAGNWTKNGVPGNWFNSTAAVFENSGDAAAVDSDVTAVSVTFRANTTISGSATLSVGEVAVSNGVSAAISAATSGAMVKTGPGTLALTSSRTDNTTLSDGTLVLSGEGVTLESSKFTFGTDDTAKSISLRLENGAVLTPVSGAFNIGAVDGSTASFYNEGDWSVSSYLALGSGVNASGEYRHACGTLTLGGIVAIGYNANSISSRSYLEVSGGTIRIAAAKHLHVGCYGASGTEAEMLVKGDGRVEVGQSLILGNKAGGTLTLTNDAYVTVGTHEDSGYTVLAYTSDQNGDACALNLFGGVLETRYIAHGSGSGLATINFDGGTLKAQDATTTLITAHNKLDVVVGPKGGTIDSSGVSFAIAEPLTGTGGMTFAGGGTVTLNAAPTYAGKSTVEIGTTLVVPASISGEKLAFAIPEELASGLYKVAAISGGGTFADDVLSTATLPVANCHFYLNAEKTEIWCVYSEIADADIWIGGASGSLNDGANWLSGNVPASGTVVVCCAAEATLTNPEGSDFAGTTIIFPTNSAPTTISGAALTGVAAIVNNSTNDVEFLNAVTFAEDIDVTQNPGAIKFTGGATGVKLSRRTDIHGTYTLTTSGNHTEIAQTTVKSDGVYLLPNATFYKHNGDFHIEAGGRAQVRNARIASKSGSTLLGTNDGEFKVDGEFLVEGNGGTPTHYTGGGTGAFIFNKIRVIQGGCIVPPGKGKTVIGGDGIVRGDGYVRVSNNGSHWIGSCADWTMYYTTIGEYTDDVKYVIYKHSSTTWSIVTFDTTDFYDSTVGRTITAESLIGAANASSAQKFKVNVTGIGKFVFANTCNTDNIFSGGLTVSNSATVAAMANAWPGKGDVTLEDSSTFEVAQSGTNTIAGALSLAENASLAFNFTDRATPPVLALASGKTANLPTTVNVKVTATDGLRVRGGEHTLTSGIDFTGKTVNLVDKPDWVLGATVDASGNLVLTAKSRGAILILY